MLNITLDADLSYEISSESDNKCRKYRQKFIYTLK
jgi:hypothetical protein